MERRRWGGLEMKEAVSENRRPDLRSKDTKAHTSFYPTNMEHDMWFAKEMKGFWSANSPDA